MRKFILNILILFVGLSPIIFPLFLGTRFLYPLLFEKKIVEFYVSSTNVIAARQLSNFLEKENIIRSAKLLRGILSFTGKDKKIESGYYEFTSGMSYSQIVRILQKNQVKSVNVIIRPGQDLLDITNNLISFGIFTEKDGLLFWQNHQKSIWGPYIQKNLELEEKIVSVEGFLLPNTYKVPKGSTFKVLLDLCLKEYKKNFGIKIQDKGFYKTIIKASLIEKEAFLPEERPIIGGIINNRLQTRKKLEFCSSLLYAMRTQKSKTSLLKNFVYNIRVKDFSLPSQYNTYQKMGLPPTPICNPSIQSIKSAIQPQKTDYLFFVSKGDGTRAHAFSKTYAEHTKKIKLYQLNPK